MFNIDKYYAGIDYQNALMRYGAYTEDELAKIISESDDWDVMALCWLCHIADMDEQYAASDADNYLDVARAAAAKLNVDIG